MDRPAPVRTKPPRRASRRDGSGPPPWTKEDARPFDPTEPEFEPADPEATRSTPTFPEWAKLGSRVALRAEPGALATVVAIEPDPQHVYELTLEWGPGNDSGLSGRVPYKWLTSTGKPDFERIFIPVR
jgi:hypothetical protein